MFIALRHHAKEKTAIFSLGAAQTRFGLTRPPRCNYGPPFVREAAQIFGVDCNCPPPISGLIHREAGIIQPTFVEKISCAICTGSPNQRGNGVDYITKPLFEDFVFDHYLGPILYVKKVEAGQGASLHRDGRLTPLEGRGGITEGECNLLPAPLLGYGKFIEPP
jgi:hypothetical protein